MLSAVVCQEKCYLIAWCIFGVIGRSCGRLGSAKIGLVRMVALVVILDR